MAEDSISENFGANTGEEVFDTWFGYEVKDAPGYNALLTAVLDGSYELSGPGAGDVEIVTGVGETGIHGHPILDPSFPYGDYGYHVHLRQAAGGAAFTLEVAIQYAPPL